MRTKIKAFLLQLPALIILIVCVIGAWYLKFAGIYVKYWATPVIITLIIIAYFWGRKLERSLHIY